MNRWGPYWWSCSTHCLLDTASWMLEIDLKKPFYCLRFFGENKDYQWTWNGCEHSQVVSVAPALHILHIYLSIYLFIYLPTWLVVGGVWSDCVVLVHRDHWRCVHLFPCRSMTHTSPLYTSPPTIQCLHPPLCPHVITPNTRTLAGNQEWSLHIDFTPHIHTVHGAGSGARAWHIIARANFAENEELQIWRQWHQCNVTETLLILAVVV